MAKKIHFLRTRFKKDIVAEFLPPRRPSNRVIIICDGAPTVPNKRRLIKFFSDKNYWAFHIRYRGTWESGGSFLRQSPHQDLLDVIDELPKGFTELFNRIRYKVRTEKIILLGGSFGGPAVILASRDPRVSTAVAIAPVVDWGKLGPAEPMDTIGRFFREAFGNGYRFTAKNWNKLRNGTFYNPVAHAGTVDGSKLLIIHAKDDRSVRWRPVVRFARQVGAQHMVLRTGGHLSTAIITQPKFYAQFRRRIKK